jgi:AraC-like DNA-binding protein
MHARSSPSAWTDDDPLSAVLLDLHLEGTFFCNGRLRAPWTLPVPEREAVAFHFVLEGGCFLKTPGAAVRAVSEGDLVLVAPGVAQVLGHDRRLTGPPVAPSRERRVGASSTMLDVDGAPSTRLLCGAMRFEGFVAGSLARMLPSVLVTERAALGPSTRAIFTAMDDESRAGRAGAATVMTRLADVVVIHAIRAWLGDASAPSGWLRGLRDPQVGAALVAVHREPELVHTVDALARRAHLSRSAFTRRFTELVALAPMQYVTRMRMHRALEMLRTERLTVAEVATRFGYDSEAAFARAFKRELSITPGRARRASTRALLEGD